LNQRLHISYVAPHAESETYLAFLSGGQIEAYLHGAARIQPCSDPAGKAGAFE